MEESEGLWENGEMIRDDTRNDTPKEGAFVFSQDMALFEIKRSTISNQSDGGIPRIIDLLRIEWPVCAVHNASVLKKNLTLDSQEAVIMGLLTP